jgi:hypothetical protein
MRTWTLCAAAAAFVASATTASAKVEFFAGVRQEAVSVDCNGANECFVYFVPDDREIEIHKVSCNFFFKAPASNNVQVNGTELLRVSKDPGKSFQGQHLIVPFQSAYSATYTQYQFLADVLWGIPGNGNWRAAVHIWYNQTVDAHFDCTISGPNPG